MLIASMNAVLFSTNCKHDYNYDYHITSLALLNTASIVCIIMIKSIRGEKSTLQHKNAGNSGQVDVCLSVD